MKQAEAPIADNAIQINLVDPNNNNKVIKSITVTRDGAKKGTNFGYNDNGNWTISMSDRASLLNQIRDALNGTSYTLDTLTTAQIAQIAQTNFGSSVNISVNAVTNIADKQTIQGQVNTALANSGYQLPGGNTLSDSQIDAIARGQYGGQVSLNVVSVTANYSTITPYGYVENETSTKKALTGISGDTLTARVTAEDSKGIKLIDNVPANEIDEASIENAMKLTEDSELQVVNAINKAIYEVAATQYEMAAKDFSGFKGTAGLQFSAEQAFDYVNGSTDLQKLLSPKFPMFDSNGKQSEIENQIQYTVQSADSGHYGTPVNVYYSYSKAPVLEK